MAMATLPMTFDERQLRSYLKFLMDPSAGTIEFRVFRGQWNRRNVVEPSQYNTTLAGWYDNPDSLVIDAKRLAQVSGYVTINPVHKDLLARSYNKLTKARKDAATCDSDIACLRWLYIDIDPRRKTEISSTDAELAAAVERRDTILSDFPDIRRASLYGRSGNGCWVLAKLPDYPNDAEHREMVARTLGHLSSTYTDDVVKVDPTTKNPSRVMCLPGTLKCKGSSMPDRPWRLVTLDGTPETPEIAAEVVAEV
jgi:hypothetical protein